MDEASKVKYILLTALTVLVALIFLVPQPLGGIIIAIFVFVGLGVLIKKSGDPAWRNDAGTWDPNAK